MKRTSSMVSLVVALMLGAAVPAPAQTFAPPFDANYTVVDLGLVPGVLPNIAPLVFLAGDSNTLLVAASATPDRRPPRSATSTSPSAIPSTR